MPKDPLRVPPVLCVHPARAARRLTLAALTATALATPLGCHDQPDASPSSPVQSEAVSSAHGALRDIFGAPRWAPVVVGAAQASASRIIAE